MDSDIAGAIEDAVTQPVERARSQQELANIAREVIGASPVVKESGSVHQAAHELFKLQDALKAKNITAASLEEAQTRFTSLLHNIPQEKHQAVGDYLMSGGRSQEAKEALLNRTGLKEGLYQPVEDAYDTLVGIHQHIEPIKGMKNNFTTSLGRHLGSESPLLDHLAEEVEPFAASTRTGNSRWNDFKARFEEALLPDAQEFAAHKHQEVFQKAEQLRLNEAAADMSLKTPELEGALEKALHTRGSLSKGGACGVVAATALAGIGLGLGAAHLLNNSHAHKELERTAAREGAQATIS